MNCLGNILWMIFGGLFSSLGWLLAGCLWCITIVGIPVGVQCFKFAGLSLCPFGKEVRYGGGAVSLLVNIIWLIVSGIPMAAGFAIWGCLLCVTLIGIPFGLQMFKLAKLALMPFGAVVEQKGQV
ncbi:YccF domain-containing protein [Lachnospiraceae bacterium KK002]